MSKEIKIAVDDSIEDMDSECFVVSPDTFTTAEWKSEGIHAFEPELEYTFNCDASIGEQASMLSELAPKLISTTAADGSPFMLLSGAARHDDKLAALNTLLAEEFVRKTTDASWGSAWALTAQGSANVRIHNRLHNVRKFGIDSGK